MLFLGKGGCHLNSFRGLRAGIFRAHVGAANGECGGRGRSAGAAGSRAALLRRCTDARCLRWSLGPLGQCELWCRRIAARCGVENAARGDSAARTICRSRRPAPRKRTARHGRERCAKGKSDRIAHGMPPAAAARRPPLPRLFLDRSLPLRPRGRRAEGELPCRGGIRRRRGVRADGAAAPARKFPSLPCVREGAEGTTDTEPCSGVEPVGQWQRGP